MAKILDYGPASANGTSRIVHEGDYGTKSMYVYNIPKQAVDCTGSQVADRRCMWGGRWRGTYVSDNDYAEIKAGTFKGMFLGDTWNINDITWRIVDFDYWYNYSGANQCRTHHIVIMPDECLYITYWHSNAEGLTSYNSSYLHNGGLSQARTTINNTFGSEHILSKPETLVNHVNTNGVPDGNANFNTTVEVPDEVMIFGERVHQQAVLYNSVPNRLSNSFGQFAAFSIGGRNYMKSSNWYWLRDISAKSYACVVDTNGCAHRITATQSGGIRPVFALCG